MQQPPNPYPQYPQQQWQQPPMPPQQQWNAQQPPYPPQQFQQPPMPPSPKKKSRKRLWLILAVVVVVLAIIIGVASQGKSQQPSSTARATQQPTSKPTPKPTVQPTKALAVTHGTPRIGGPMSDFYGKYGHPNNQGSVPGSETWILNDQNQTIIDAAPNAGGIVDYVNITNGTAWNNQQMQSYCEQFMPSDASQFNQDGPYIDYHSSVGEIVMELGQASCVITIAGQ